MCCPLIQTQSSGQVKLILVHIRSTEEDFLVHDVFALESFAGLSYAPEKLNQVKYFSFWDDLFI